MKRICIRATACALLFALCLTLFGCGDYKPIKSSKSELRPVAELGGETVRFELLRAFFFAEASALGTPSAFEGEGGDELTARALSDAMLEIAELYATLAVCRKYGIDPYSKSVDKKINEWVKADIEGGVVDGIPVLGHGSQKKYLAALGESHLNDSVNRLLYRVTISSSLLYEMQVENLGEGENALTEEALREFYLSDACTRISWFYLSHDSLSGLPEGKMERVHAELLACTDYEEMKRIMIGNSTLSAQDIEDGFFIGSHAGIGGTYRELIAHAFSLGENEVSREIIETADGKYILIGLEKPEVGSALYEKYRESLHALCLSDRLYAEIEAYRDTFLSEAVYTELYKSLTYASFLGE